MITVFPFEMKFSDPECGGTQENQVESHEAGLPLSVVFVSGRGEPITVSGETAALSPESQPGVFCTPWQGWASPFSAHRRVG